MIVIPMAGRSQRFFDAGHPVPKHQLLLGGESVFAHAVGSFVKYFNKLEFIFVTSTEEAAAFAGSECERLGVRHARPLPLNWGTSGQAETVEAGLDALRIPDSEPVTIFNIDTFRPGFEYPEGFEAYDGWLEVFEGEGANWSYVRPAEGDAPLVLETAEKRPISNLCCTGLYHFARAGDFRSALAAERAAPQAAELYVAPLYNHLIGQGKRIAYSRIDPADVIFCGTPAEYEALSRPA